jgi:hypothetical protein
MSQCARDDMRLPRAMRTLVGRAPRHSSTSSPADRLATRLPPHSPEVIGADVIRDRYQKSGGHVAVVVAGRLSYDEYAARGAPITPREAPWSQHPAVRSPRTA